MKKPISNGIDLGTTNSALAVFRGNAPVLVRSNRGHEITPSAVCRIPIGQSVTQWVGVKARDQLLTRPNDVASEFKLQMGMTDWRYRFETTGEERTAVELSTSVLEELIKSARERFPEEIDAVVIAVPNAFQPPSYRATKEAGLKAGFRYVEMIEEPVAAAQAFAFEAANVPDRGYWLVFDLGGGTFDAAVVKVEEGVFTVVRHAGDKHLGGKDIDEKLVEEILIPALRRERAYLADPGATGEADTVYWRLKRAAEVAKIDLSTESQTLVEAPNLDDQGYDFRLPLKRDAKFTGALEPTVSKAINISRKVLLESQLKSDDVDRVILVGGPTLSPYVRSRVQDELGIRVDWTVDPMTAVAKGAAIYARGRMWEPSDKISSTALVDVALQYESMTLESEPLIAGRVSLRKDGSNCAGWKIEITRLDTAGTAVWSSGQITLDEEGRFARNVRCEPPQADLHESSRENRFRLAVTDNQGAPVEAHPTEFNIDVTRVGVGEVTLPRDIGVILSDGSVEWAFPGEPRPALPCERTIHTLRTTRELRKGTQEDEALSIPIVWEGLDRDNASLNHKIGTLRVYAKKIFTNIPTGTPVEVTIAVNKGREISVSAYFPDYEIDVEPMVVQEIPIPKRSELEARMTSVKEGISKLRTVQDKDDTLGRVLREIDDSGLVEEAERLIRQSGDVSSAEKALEVLMRLQKLLLPFEAKGSELLSWMKFEQECRKNVDAVRRFAHSLELPPEVEMKLNHLLAQFDKVCEARDTEAAERLAFGDIPGLPGVVEHARPGPGVGDVGQRLIIVVPDKGDTERAQG